MQPLRASLQIVFQDPWGALNPRMVISRALEEPLKLHTDLEPAARAQRVRELAQRVHLPLASLERFPIIPRRVSGYNLDDLLPERGFHVARALAGTEGTCVTLLEATVHLVGSPPARSLLVAGYEDAALAADHVPEVLEHRPVGLEGVDETLIEDMTLLGQHVHDLSLLPEGRGWLLIETGGETKQEADDAAERAHLDTPPTARPRKAERGSATRSRWRGNMRV